MIQIHQYINKHTICTYVCYVFGSSSCKLFTQVDIFMSIILYWQCRPYDPSPYIDTLIICTNV
jgi:hypothetical protein